MQLESIEIRNFRSIKEMNIEIKEINNRRCIILVGKNEAGKSNVLKAIAAIFNAYSISTKDQRKEIGDETILDEHCYIRAIFSLKENDIKQIIKNFTEMYQNTKIIVFQGGLTLTDFIEEYFSKIFWQLNIKNETKRTRYYWKIDGNKYAFDKDIYLKRGNLFEEDGIDKELLTPDKLCNIFFEHCMKKLDTIENCQCIFWEYKKEFLLPSSILLNDLRTSPDSFVPLKNIFHLTGIYDIDSAIDKALQKDNHLDNLLEKISTKTTKKFKEIWKDLEKTEFVLRKDGDSLNICVKNKVRYSCEDRSDGFKRFLAILIMLSTPSRLNNLNEKSIILIDEPDTCLYPTSARFLRDELLNIAENSIVIYSTHSPFMIDTQDIERHIVIEKENDISVIKKFEEKSPYAEDELIRRAIGTHIFETIKPKNLIFEGYTDYKLFEQMSDTKVFEDYGKVYLGGIKETNTLVQMIMLANKQFVIIADSDETSRKKRQDFERTYPDFKDNWVEYAVCGASFKTLEDFYKQEYIDKELKNHNILTNKSCTTNMIAYIDSCITTLNLSDNESKELKQKIKHNLATNVSKDDIKQEYSTFLKHLLKTTKNL